MSVARKQIQKSHASQTMVRRVPLIRVRPPSLWEALTVWWAWLDGYSFFAALIRKTYVLPRDVLIKCVPAHRGRMDRFFLFFGQRPVNGVVVDKIPKNLKAQTYPPESPFLPKMPKPREMAKIYFTNAVVTHYLASLVLMEFILWIALRQSGTNAVLQSQWSLRFFYFWTLIYPFVHYRIFSPRLEFVFFRKLLRVEGTFIQLLCVLDYFTR